MKKLFSIILFLSILFSTKLSYATYDYKKATDEATRRRNQVEEAFEKRKKNAQKIPYKSYLRKPEDYQNKDLFVKGYVQFINKISENDIYLILSKNKNNNASNNEVYTVHFNWNPEMNFIVDELLDIYATGNGTQIYIVTNAFGQKQEFDGPLLEVFSFNYYE